MSNRNKGIFFIILSSLCFSLMSTFVKLAGELPPIQKSFFRNFIALIIAFFIILKNKNNFKFNKKNLPCLLLRSFFGTVGILANYYAIEHLILADATMLNKLAPFFVIIFSYFILKENIKLWQIFCIIIAFVGSLFIINSNFVLSIFTGKVSFGSEFKTLPAVIGVLGAMSAGVAYTMLRKLTLMGEKSYFIVFFFSTFSCIVTLPFIIFNYYHMNLQQLLFLIFSGVFAAFGQFAITAAYSKAPAREISIFDYSQIIFSAIIGFFIFNQKPDKFSIIGYVIICFVAIVMFIFNNKKD